MDDLLALRPGRWSYGDRRRKRRVRVGRLEVAVVEIIDELLDADSVARRQRAVVNEFADVGVGGSVDIDGEGRNRGVGNSLDRIGCVASGYFSVSTYCWNGAVATVPVDGATASICMVCGMGTGAMPVGPTFFRNRPPERLGAN